MNKFAKIVWSGLLLIPVLAAAAGPKTSPVPYQRTVTKTFTVNAGAQLNIDNKYGNVNLHAWSRNEIKAVITIKADAGGADAAKQLADQVSIQSSQSGNEVSLITNYESSSGSFWKQFFSSSPKGKKSVHIDYEVYVPQSLAAMSIKNQYGNVTGDQIPGNMNLNMNYGTFHIGNVAGSLSLHANYCEGNLFGIKSGEAHLNYTDFSLDKISAFQVSSNYSGCKITQAGDLKISSNYGDITADNIGSIDSRSTYSDYKINTLSTQGNITTAYGDVNIKTLGNQFKALTVRPTYSDVSVGIPEGLPLQIDIQLARGDIRTGSIPLQVIEKTESHGTSKLKATSKGGGAHAAIITIHGTSADVNLSQK